MKLLKFITEHPDIEIKMYKQNHLDEDDKIIIIRMTLYRVTEGIVGKRAVTYEILISSEYSEEILVTDLERLYSFVKEK